MTNNLIAARKDAADASIGHKMFSIICWTFFAVHAHKADTDILSVTIS